MEKTIISGIPFRNGRGNTIRPFGSVARYLRGTVATVVLVLVTVVAFGSVDNDEASQASAPTEQETRITATSVPAPTPTPAPASAQDINATEEERAAAVEFLTTIESAGIEYVRMVFVGPRGEQPVIYLIGTGEVEAGLNLWKSSLDSYRDVLAGITPPHGIANSSEIVVEGLAVLSSTDGWIDETFARMKSGEVVDPVLPLSTIEQRFQSGANISGVVLKEQLRIYYKIDRSEVPRACGGRQAGNCV